MISIRKKNKFLLLLTGLAIISLTGCATSPQIFGIADSEWKGYDKAKQKEILNNYKQLDTEVQQQDQEVSKITGGDTTTIDVKIFGGEAMLPPFVDWHAYMPATFTIVENSCANTLLNQEGGEGKITLRACYKDKKLRLDPSRYDPDKKDGTVTIPYSPLWDQGFTYHGINTDGYVKLKDVNVVVKQN